MGFASFSGSRLRNIRISRPSPGEAWPVTPGGAPLTPPSTPRTPDAPGRFRDASGTPARRVRDSPADTPATLRTPPKRAGTPSRPSGPSRPFKTLLAPGARAFRGLRRPPGASRGLRGPPRASGLRRLVCGGWDVGFGSGFRVFLGLPP